jgi:hypothetical protein
MRVWVGERVMGFLCLLRLFACAAEAEAQPERKQLHRKVVLRDLNHDDPVAAVLRLALEDHCDLIVLGGSSETEQTPPVDFHEILRHSPCRVCLITPPGIPQEIA